MRVFRSPTEFVDLRTPLPPRVRLAVSRVVDARVNCIAEPSVERSDELHRAWRHLVLLAEHEGVLQ